MEGTEGHSACCMWSLKVLQVLGSQPYWVGGILEYKYVAMAEREFFVEEEASAHTLSSQSVSSLP